MMPLDWFENGRGDIVWHDSKEKSFTNDKGVWKNVGANLNEVKEHLKLPEAKSFNKTDASLVSIGNATGGAPLARICLRWQKLCMTRWRGYEHTRVIARIYNPCI